MTLLQPPLSDREPLNVALNALQRVSQAALALQTDPTGTIDDLLSCLAERDIALMALGLVTARQHYQRQDLAPPKIPHRPPPPAPVVSPARQRDSPATTASVQAHTRQAKPSSPSPSKTHRPSSDVKPVIPAATTRTPAPPKVPRIPSPPASSASLSALRDRFSATAEPPTPSVTPRPVPSIRALAEAWGRPDQPKNPQTLATLLAACATVDDWLRLPKKRQRLLLSYATARCRQVQLDNSDLKLESVFNELTTWSQTYRPGRVWGLALDHQPTYGTWTADATAAWSALGLGDTPATTGIGALTAALKDNLSDDALLAMVRPLIDDGTTDQDHLCQLLVPHIALLKGDRHVKRLRKRVARHRDRTQPAATTVTPADDWEHVALTRGKRAVLLGGDQRNGVVARVQAALDFSTLGWERGHDPRRTETLAQRVRGGSVDLVLLIRRFIHHSASDVIEAACASSGVPFVAVSGGYGVSSIQRAIVEQLGRSSASDTTR